MPLFSLLVLMFFKSTPQKYWVFKEGKDLETSVIFVNPFYSIYNTACKEVAGWHMSELERLDSDFRFQQAQIRLMNARNSAQNQGIDPLDPRYPDIFDFHKPPEIKVQK